MQSISKVSKCSLKSREDGMAKPTIKGSKRCSVLICSNQCCWTCFEFSSIRKTAEDW